MWRLYRRSPRNSLAAWLPLRAGAAVPEWETLLGLGLWTDQAPLTAAAGSSSSLGQRRGLATAPDGSAAGSDPSRWRSILPKPSCSSGSSISQGQPTRTLTSSSSSSSTRESTPQDDSGPSFERLQRAFQEFKGSGAGRRAAAPAKAKSQAGASSTGRRRRQAAAPLEEMVAGLLEEEQESPQQRPQQRSSPQPPPQQSPQQQQQQQDVHGRGSSSEGSAEGASASSSSDEDEKEEGQEGEFEDVFEIFLVDLEDLGGEGEEDALDFLPAGSLAGSTAAAAAAANAGDAQQPPQRRRRPGRLPGLLRLGRPMRPEAEAFLSSKGVDTQAVVAMLPRRASELSLERVQATWALLEEFGILDPAGLIKARPSLLSIDPEAGLRPKFQAIGLRGHALSELFTPHPSLAYTNPAGLKETLAALEDYILAAAKAGLLPCDTSLPQQLAAKPRQWSVVLPHSRKHIEGVAAVLRKKLGFTKAQCGACIAMFPMGLSHAPATVAMLCDFYASMLGRAAAAELLLSKPLLLRSSQELLSSNLRYLRQQLGWSEQEVCRFLQDQPGTFGHHIAGTLMQHLLQECHRVLGITPSDMLRQHPSTLRCSPRQAAPRCAFLQRAGKLGELKTPRFIKDSSRAWAARLACLGLRWEDWLQFEEEYWEQPAAQEVLEQAAKELAASRKRQGVALLRRIQGQGGSDSGSAGAAGSDSNGAGAGGSRAAGQEEGLEKVEGQEQAAKEGA